MSRVLLVYHRHPWETVFLPQQWQTLYGAAVTRGFGPGEWYNDPATVFVQLNDMTKKSVPQQKARKDAATGRSMLPSRASPVVSAVPSRVASAVPSRVASAVPSRVASAAPSPTASGTPSAVPLTDDEEGRKSEGGTDEEGSNDEFDPVKALGVPPAQFSSAIADWSTEDLKRIWRSPVYSCFQDNVIVQTYQGRPCHFFKCAARSCRTSAGGVCRFSDKGDHASTANLKYHAAPLRPLGAVVREDVHLVCSTPT